MALNLEIIVVTKHAVIPFDGFAGTFHVAFQYL